MDTISRTTVAASTALAQDLRPILEIQGSNDTYQNLLADIRHNHQFYAKRQPLPGVNAVNIGSNFLREYPLLQERPNNVSLLFQLTR